ncbi:DUF551 domain-containing protein [Serratia marcescens]|nr:DUF551 domain-containing protein [Serratia marcescens]MCG5374458.1 DUF551 domain-containing protein [Serratia marcescens]
MTLTTERLKWIHDAATELSATKLKMTMRPDELLVLTSELLANREAQQNGWIACSERMPEVGERDWRTALPVLVKCEIGVIPAYYGFTYHEGEQCFGFMESIKFGDASGSGPEQHENRLMMHVTHWMPLPAAPEGGN